MKAILISEFTDSWDGDDPLLIPLKVDGLAHLPIRPADVIIRTIYLNTC